MLGAFLFRLRCWPTKSSPEHKGWLQRMLETLFWECVNWWLAGQKQVTLANQSICFWPSHVTAHSCEGCGTPVTGVFLEGYALDLIASPQHIVDNERKKEKYDSITHTCTQNKIPKMNKADCPGNWGRKVSQFCEMTLPQSSGLSGPWAGRKQTHGSIRTISPLLYYFQRLSKPLLCGQIPRDNRHCACCGAC